ncbi:MAG: hypothetical protein HOP12_07705 [Candidatus Eisenbacteria bacterium]|uniref:Energy-coupling factor transporter transmembrane protein EcfT n=1 Tax=Eiseniibacteriota bacterium TaxID=2212470 RepID=A0A849SY44_UNCEI|nr:hypothetical protein [Candidatus Eisenbacteria bacterium]
MSVAFPNAGVSVSPDVDQAGPERTALAIPLLIGAGSAALISTRFETCGLAVAVALGVCAIHRVRPFGPAALRAALVAAAIAWLLNVYLTPGQPLVAWPLLFGHAGTREGTRLGLLVVLRMLGAWVATRGVLALAAPDRVMEVLAGGLTPLLGSRRARDLGAAAVLALRLGPLVAEESRRIAAIQRLRAGRAPRSLVERFTWKRAALVPGLAGALERAERLALVLEARHGWETPSRATPQARGPWLLGMSIGGALIAAAILWRG